MDAVLKQTKRQVVAIKRKLDEGGIIARRAATGATVRSLIGQCRHCRRPSAVPASAAEH
jgi:hypothetical protein